MATDPVSPLSKCTKVKKVLSQAVVFIRLLDFSKKTGWNSNQLVTSKDMILFPADDSCICYAKKERPF